MNVRKIVATATAVVAVVAAGLLGAAGIGNAAPQAATQFAPTPPPGTGVTFYDVNMGGGKVVHCQIWAYKPSGTAELASYKGEFWCDQAVDFYLSVWAEWQMPDGTTQLGYLDEREFNGQSSGAKTGEGCCSEGLLVRNYIGGGVVNAGSRITRSDWVQF